MEAKFGVCQDCGRDESRDCPMYLCVDKDGFFVMCCMVYVINHHLRIIHNIDEINDSDTDYED